MFINTWFLLLIIIGSVLLGYYMRGSSSNSNDGAGIKQYYDEISNVRQISFYKTRKTTSLFVSKIIKSKKMDMYPLPDDAKIIISINNSTSAFDIEVYSDEEVL